jgi:hypothetical protein
MSTIFLDHTGPDSKKSATATRFSYQAKVFFLPLWTHYWLGYSSHNDAAVRGYQIEVIGCPVKGVDLAQRQCGIQPHSRLSIERI